MMKIIKRNTSKVPQWSCPRRRTWRPNSSWALRSPCPNLCTGWWTKEYSGVKTKKILTAFVKKKKCEDKREISLMVNILCFNFDELGRCAHLILPCPSRIALGVSDPEVVRTRCSRSEFLKIPKHFFNFFNVRLLTKAALSES